ncbi:MAG: 16S rRNA (guanine(966)-N(2))-methyltransferase RsmD [Phycisphaeraceae bacterium]|nr:16S rRNA (guanine(966)-N(2))-methyltransferase RsmD [Phycisphaeraceae bacterium]
MRIIAGEFRSRKLFTPPDAEVTRPIPDRVKESLFGLLRGHIEGSEIFDGFAGTGAIGLEALSRGAKHVVFVEQNRQIARVLKQNIDMLNVGDRVGLVQSDVLGMGAISRCPREARVIFLDPPYPLAEDPLGWRRITSAMQELAKNLTPDGFIIVRTPWPFFETEQEPEASQPAHKPKGKWKKEDKDRWNKSDWQDEDRIDSRRSPRVDNSANNKSSRNPSRGTLLSGSAQDEDPFGDEWEEIDPLDAQAMAQGMTEPMTEESELSESPAATPKTPRKHAELKIPGLKGPETHIYRHTAVHFYMRQ